MKYDGKIFFQEFYNSSIITVGLGHGNFPSDGQDNLSMSRDVKPMIKDIVYRNTPTK